MERTKSRAVSWALRLKPPVRISIEFQTKLHVYFAAGLVERQVCCVGPFYLRLLHPNYVGAASGDDHCLPADGVDDLDEEEGEEVQFEDDVDYLQSLDPKEWKTQDHYRVLGLTSKRIKASEDDIKRACKIILPII